ncbi:MAG: carbohydrate ABC transporter permease [Chloroflexota bacterium]|nr:carbohydrate ABC transporter permease [Chloroflexota bacterium]
MTIHVLDLTSKRQNPVERLYQRLLGNMSLSEFVLWLLVLIAFGLFFGLPLIWLLLAPSKLDNELLSLPPLSFGSFDNYIRAWNNLNVYDDGALVRWGLNSLFYTLTSLIISVAISVPAGYALATAKFAGRRVILWTTLITMILPGSALVLPLFLEMNAVRLVNTPWSVILPAAFFPFGVYLAFIYFANFLPNDLLSAGRVDGCSEWQLFRYIGLPLARTLLGLLAFLSFTANWNSYFLPFVMLNNSELFNLPLGLKALMAGTSAINPTFATDLPIKRPEAALTGLLMVLPVAIVFIFSQRYVISGALTGGIKE